VIDTGYHRLPIRDDQASIREWPLSARPVGSRLSDEWPGSARLAVAARSRWRSA